MTKTKTRKQLVLETLTTARRRGRVVIDGNTYKTSGGWIDGWLLTHPSLGGSEGLRRLRELRQDGYQIDMRVSAKGTTRQYRITPRKATK
jgi:hypothetical protein